MSYVNSFNIALTILNQTKIPKAMKENKKVTFVRLTYTYVKCVYDHITYGRVRQGTPTNPPVNASVIIKKYFHSNSNEVNKNLLTLSLVEPPGIHRSRFNLHQKFYFSILLT